MIDAKAEDFFAGKGNRAILSPEYHECMKSRMSI